MKVKVSIIKSVFWLYYFLLLFLYHYKVKNYFYWTYVVDIRDLNLQFSFLNFLIATVIVWINIEFINSKFNESFSKIGTAILSSFFILLTIPSLIAFTSKEMYPLLLVGFHQLLFFSVYYATKIKINLNKIPTLNKSQSMYLLLIIISIGIIPYIIAYGSYINLKNLLLIDVYETRSKLKGFTNPYFGYTYSVFTKILIPMLIIFALELKRKIFLIIGILFLITFYLFGAHKTVYIGLIVILIFYRFSYYLIIKRILQMSVGLIAVSIILATVGIDDVWHLIFRRVHFLPTLLDVCYVDFFKGKPLLWSESILKSFIDYPYDLNHANLIGEKYFNRPLMRANNGLVSDGYMNFGAWGVLINIFIVFSYVLILNNLKIPSKYFGLYFLLVFSFVSSSTLTVLLTHGGVVLLLISIFILNEEKS